MKFWIKDLYKMERTDIMVIELSNKGEKQLDCESAFQNRRMKMKAKKILSLLLTAGMLGSMCATSAFAADNSRISVRVQNEAGQAFQMVAFSSELGQPYEDANYRTMVPLRTTADAMGVTVDWNEASKQAAFTRKSETKTEQVIFTVDSNKFTFVVTEQGKEAVSVEKEMDTAAVQKDNRIYTPVRFLAETLGYLVTWDNDSQTVTLSMDKAPAAPATPTEGGYAEARPLLLQGAMDIETEDMIQALENPQTVDIDKYHFVRGTLHGYPVVVSRTEQGLANAAATTVLAMQNFDPIAVINQGTSGGHDPELHTFDIVLGENSIDYAAIRTTASAKNAGVDYKAYEKNGVYAYDAAQKTFVKQFEYPADNTLLKTAQSVTDTYKSGKIVTGVISTADSWNNQVDKMLEMHETLGSSCEEMETNAVAQVCKTYGVPFLGIRILSNTGIYNEDFNPKTGPACQEYTLTVANKYIDTILKTKEPQKADAPITVDYQTQKRPLLLQGAMDIEMQDMAKALTDAKEYTIGQWHFVAGMLEGYPVVVSRTEQGIANAGAATILAVKYFNPIAIINQGTSGGHDPELHTSDIVLGEYTIPSSAWRTKASAKGAGVDYKAFEMIGVAAYDKEQKTFVKSVKYPGDQDLLTAAEAVADTYQEGKIVKGTISSSDEWNNQIDRMLYLHEVNGSSCEEMESNAVAQICKTYEIPYLAIRILSNTGIYGEDFNPATGPQCQSYTLNVAKQYIQTVLSK